jgi:flagellar biosynthesis/type III secretory pathway protein FliH
MEGINMWKKLIEKLTYKFYRKGVAQGYIEGTDEMLRDVKSVFKGLHMNLDNLRENVNTDSEKRIVDAVKTQLEENELRIAIKYE